MSIIYMNILNQNEVILVYDENTTVGDLVLNLKEEDFGDI